MHDKDTVALRIASIGLRDKDCANFPA